MKIKPTEIEIKAINAMDSLLELLGLLAVRRKIITHLKTTKNHNTMQDYQKQASDLLKKMNVVFTTKFLKNDFYFYGDKETRDIFKVSFRRDKKSFSLSFGNSLKDSTGSGGNPPTAYDVLSCIQKYEVGTFENFCSDFGYDTDSRRAEKTYKAVCKEWKKVSSFFTPEELKELQDVQ